MMIGIVNIEQILVVEACATYVQQLKIQVYTRYTKSV